jgi:hypothetical protein
MTFEKIESLSIYSPLYSIEGQLNNQIFKKLKIPKQLKVIIVYFNGFVRGLTAAFWIKLFFIGIIPKIKAPRSL